MRNRRTKFIPPIRVFDEEKDRVGRDAGRAGFSLSDYVRMSLGLAPEHPSRQDVSWNWSLSRSGALFYRGKPWKGNLAQLLNGRCVVPQEREGG